jgi:hypothetical protein
VSELNSIHKHAQCVNWSVGISYPHYRACPLTGSFLQVFTYCDGRETESDEILYSDASSLVIFFSGDSYCDNRERVLMFDYDTKE